MKDSINASNELVEFSDIYRIASNINLDMDVFKSDFEDYNISKNIEGNIMLLDAAGIYGTPTIMINNRLIYNSSSIKEIEDLLLQAINQE